MKLNPKCIRAVLLKVEELHRVTVNDDGAIDMGILPPHELYEALPEYGRNDVYYTIFNLSQAGLLECLTLESDDALNIYGILYMTYEGHEFLDKVRDETVWKETLGVAQKVGNFGLGMLSRIAEGVATAALNKFILGGP